MHIHTRNVNSAFRSLVGLFADTDEGPKRGDIVCSSQSRNGKVMVINEPMTITYSHPRERVLFNAARDTNPFSLVYESLWMLAGRNDLAPMVYYTAKFADYSDDGETLNGAYGYRWRQATVYKQMIDGAPEGEDRYYQSSVDQLRILISHLKADPTSRRAVLEMWNCEDDLLKIGLKKTTELRDEKNPSYRGTIETTTGASRDVCCLSWDTRFRSPEGDMTIQDLAQRFQSNSEYRFPIYSVDVVTGDQRLSWMTNAWRTGIKPVFKVILDDGSSVRMTGDHVVYRKKKIFQGKRCVDLAVEECQVCDLKVGESLLSEISKNASARTSGVYRMFKRNIFRNTSWTNMVREHREYWQFVYSEGVGDNDVHHRDENTLNNKIDNLERISSSEHSRYHKLKRNPHTHMSEPDKKKRGAIHSAVMQSGGVANTPEHIRTILNKRPPWRTPEQDKILWDWVSSVSNHRIVSIEKDGFTAVYDFTVPGRHNAVLSNGLIVHNCNLDVMFSIRTEIEEIDTGGVTPWMSPVSESVKTLFLDMTVTNRSNDLILGMLGANYVTFSVLLEYMAACIGVEVGKYSQFSNNLHAYEWNWKPEEWLADTTPDYYTDANLSEVSFGQQVQSWGQNFSKRFSLVKNPHTFDLECARFVQHNYPNSPDWKPRSWPWQEPFFLNVAQPMMDAWHFYKWKTREGLELAIKRLRDVQADDWRTVCTSWMERRLAKHG